MKRNLRAPTRHARAAHSLKCGAALKNLPERIGCSRRQGQPRRRSGNARSPYCSRCSPARSSSSRSARRASRSSASGVAPSPVLVRLGIEYPRIEYATHHDTCQEIPDTPHGSAKV